MRPTPGRSRLFLAGLILVALGACQERRGRGTGDGAGTGSQTRERHVPESAPAPLKTTPLPGDEPSPPEPTPRPPSVAPSAPEAGASGRFELGEIHDAGPAAPMAAHANGIYFITKAGGMFIARREGKSLLGIDAPREAFFRYGRGPAISKTHAYWISSQGKLTRAPLLGGPPESLTKARSGARVSLVQHDEDVVFYLADEEPHLRAMLYTERGGALRISPDGADVTSLAVVEGGAFPRALMLEGRSGMSPLHARTIRLRSKGPELGPDEVIWVGPGSQPLTEVRATPFRGTGGIAFVATAKSVLEFGIASLELLPTGLLAQDPSWHLYENGIDPAPLETITACGATFVLFSIPTTRAPRAPQELRIAELDKAQLRAEETLVRARAINDISAARLPPGPLGEGFLLAWTADHRTWGMVVNCKRR